MSDLDDNPWLDAAIVMTCPRCSVSAEHPAPIEHKTACMIQQKRCLERDIEAERSGGWIVSEPAR